MKLLAGVSLALCLGTSALAAPPQPVVPELEYLKTINQASPTADPQLIFLLSAQFSNANRFEEGVSVFDAMLRDFGPRLSPLQRALYLTAAAPLHAQYAARLPADQRAAAIRQALSMLEEARALTGDRLYVMHWTSGVVRAGLPPALGQAAQARKDLEWCEQHSGEFPHPGWLREVYFQLGKMHRAEGDEAGATNYLHRSGYQTWDKPVTLTAPFSVDDTNGNTFSAREIREVVPGKVYQIGGIDFTQYYFIISDDRKELISIDAGARPDTARAAYEVLHEKVPNLPPLTTVFITHAHWDHVGGQRFFRSLSPQVKFYGRENNSSEQMRESTSGRGFANRFFGAAFSANEVWQYKPDVPVTNTETLRIGGTSFELIPANGGETEDALMIFMPKQGVIFVGDVMMPYLGGPFVEEGDLDGLFAAIEEIKKRDPKVLLHGHDPLTRVFDSPSMLLEVRSNLRWLREQVIEAMRAGEERGAIQQKNLIPPGITNQSPRAQLAYLVERENTINRLYDQHSGYWHTHLEGMDSVTLAEKGRMMMDYLGLDDAHVAAGAKRMIADGRYEQAAMLVQWARARGPVSPELDDVGRLAFAKLAEHYQEFNPFKFIIYTGQAHLDVAPVDTRSFSAEQAAH